MPEPKRQDDAEDDRDFYEERAAIAEFDGGLARPEAEALAHDRMQRTRLSRRLRTRARKA